MTVPTIPDPTFLTPRSPTKRDTVPITFSNYKELLLKNYKTYEEILSILKTWTLEEVKEFQNDKELIEALINQRQLPEEAVNAEFRKRVKNLHSMIKVRDRLFADNKIDDLDAIGFKKENGNWNYNPKYIPSKMEEEELKFYQTTKIVPNDKVRVIKGCGAALKWMEGYVIDMHPKDEIDEDHNYFTVEFRVQEIKDRKRYLYNLFRELVPEENLQLIERWVAADSDTGYTRKGLDEPSPFLRNQRDSFFSKIYKCEFPNSLRSFYLQ